MGNFCYPHGAHIAPSSICPPRRSTRSYVCRQVDVVLLVLLPVLARLPPPCAAHNARRCPPRAGALPPRETLSEFLPARAARQQRRLPRGRRAALCLYRMRHLLEAHRARAPSRRPDNDAPDSCWRWWRGPASTSGYVGVATRPGTGTATASTRRPRRGTGRGRGAARRRCACMARQGRGSCTPAWSLASPCARCPWRQARRSPRRRGAAAGAGAAARG